MNKTETAKILAVIAAAYPNFKVDEIQVTVWQEMLGDIHYSVVNMAVKKTILENKFAPSIAEVRQSAFDILNPDNLSAAESWGMVINAIHGYGSYRQKEALESLPAEVAETVKQMGWQEMCRADNVEVIRGQYIKLYEQLKERNRKEKYLSADMRKAIEAYQGGPRLIGGRA